MLGALLLGLLLGTKHALEADHVAAVAALATRSASVAERVKLASAWGIGHAGTILFLGGSLLALGLTLPPGLGRAFEAGVGLMLVVLGADVLRRLRGRHVHFHAHRHGDGTAHFHAHAHEPARPHAADHDHVHPARPLPRALLVGSVHGLAGSAALVLLSLELGGTTAQALLYLLAFGIGSILGMTALSLAISVPLRLSARHLGGAWRGLEGALGVLTIVLGSWMALVVLRP